MTWYRVYKIFKGGQSKPDYIQVPKYSKKDIVEEYAISWAENADGGHNYGWRVYWSGVKKPSQKWLKEELVRMEVRILGYKEAIVNTHKAIEQLEEMLN